MADTLNWAKLPEYPVYNAAMMKPCAEIDSSILGIIKGKVLTPEMVFEDTVAHEDRFTLKLSAIERLITEDVNVRKDVSKGDFIRIMGECMRQSPKLFPWEHKDFFSIINSGIEELCDALISKGWNDLFLRSGKEYVLSDDVGYGFVGNVPVAAFSGLIIKAEFDRAHGIKVNLTIPRIILNTMAKLEDAKLMYTDKASNISISFPWKSVKRDGDNYTATFRRSDDVLEIKGADKTKNIAVPSGTYTELMTKKLVLPTTNFQFRTIALASAMKYKQYGKAVSTQPTEKLAMRLRGMGDYNE